MLTLTLLNTNICHVYFIVLLHFELHGTLGSLKVLIDVIIDLGDSLLTSILF